MSTLPLWEWLWDRQQGKCWLCEKPMTMREGSQLSMTFDHVIPLAHGGVNNPRNKLLAHFHCNNRRAAPKVWTKISVIRALAFRKLSGVSLSELDLTVLATSRFSRAAAGVAKARPGACTSENTGFFQGARIASSGVAHDQA